MGQTRGTRTRLIFGGVVAHVSLQQTSGKPTDAKHDTRRVVGNVTETLREPLSGELEELAAAGGVKVTDAETGEEIANANGMMHGDEPLETSPADGGADLAPGQHPPDPSLPGPDAPGPEEPAAPDDRPAREGVGMALRVGSDDGEVSGWLEHSPDLVYANQSGTVQMHEPTVFTAPASRVEQGVYRETGEWVDLTDRLAQIDEATRKDGLTVVGTIPSASVPRIRVRGAQYIASDGPDAPRVMALLHHALRLTDRAAVVVWTKKTAQAVGIVIAQAKPTHALVLLEVEFAQNMREPSRKVTEPLTAEVTKGELRAAADLLEAFAMPAHGLDELRDERAAKRAELLALAREGKVSDYVEPVTAEVSDAEQAFAAALSA